MYSWVSVATGCRQFAAAHFICLALLGYAPLQCSRDPDPKLRRYETPGEALYGLAAQFKSKGDLAAWRTTLEYLVARYPNSRFAKMARDDLDSERESEGAEGRAAPEKAP